MPGQSRRFLAFIIVSNFMLYFGFQLWQTMFNNFAVEELGAGPASIGLVQALREVPGLIGIALGVLALFLSEVHIMALSVILLGLGIVLTGQTYSIGMLLVSTLIMSLGFHFFYPSSNAVLLMAADQRDTPRLLGLLGSLTAIAAVAGTAAVFFLADPWGYRSLFMAAGVLVMVGGLVSLFLGRARNTLPPRRRIILRRRYWHYYALSFLFGSRRHILTTFAVLLLVRQFGVDVKTVAILFLVNNLVGIYAMKLAGQWVERAGERTVLVLTFAALALVFLGYAYLNNLVVLCALFVLDNVLLGFGIALTSYFQKIAVDPEEITSNLAVDQAINHIAAVAVPLAGGTIWELYGAQAPFLAGVAIVVAGLILALFIRTSPQPATVSGV